MSLEQWLSEVKLKPHQTTRQEVSQLLQAVERNIRDASIEALSPGNRFTIAYQAALQLATILLYASGYRPSASVGHHHPIPALYHGW
jgi:integrase